MNDSLKYQTRFLTIFKEAVNTPGVEVEIPTKNLSPNNFTSMIMTIVFENIKFQIAQNSYDEMTIYSWNNISELLKLPEKEIHNYADFYSEHRQFKVVRYNFDYILKQAKNNLDFSKPYLPPEYSGKVDLSDLKNKLYWIMKDVVEQIEKNQPSLLKPYFSTTEIELFSNYNPEQRMRIDTKLLEKLVRSKSDFDYSWPLAKYLKGIKKLSGRNKEYPWEI